jgi:hypothetical protein
VRLRDIEEAPATGLSGYGSCVFPGRQTDPARQNERARPRDRAYMRAIAAKRRGRGRVQIAVRRALIANPLAKTRDLLGWAYPRGERRHWHYWSVYRALSVLETDGNKR